VSPEENPAPWGGRRKKNDNGRPCVSVVIVNWNTCAELARCLESLARHHQELTLRILVVDNASTDGSVEMLENRFPEVELIANSENVGFAAANNQAFAALDQSCGFVLVLNPDIVFTQSTLLTLLGFFAGRPDVHVVTPRVLGPDGRLQRGCRRRDPVPLAMLGSLSGLSRFFPRSRKLAGYTYGDVPEDRVQEIQAASGSFIFMRREVLQSVGGFDERFFMYAEDLDWCLRARKKGFSIYYYPAASVIHQRGASSLKRPIRSLWHLHYTAFLYIRKHHRRDYSTLWRAVLYPSLAAHLFLAVLWAMARALFTGSKMKENR